MRLEDSGVEIVLVFDEDGYPYVDINLRGYEGDNHRPTVEVSINGELIHSMFSNKDQIGDYIPHDECLANKTHLLSCDKDGFCNVCGFMD